MSGTASASSDIINGEAAASTYYPSAGGAGGTTIDFQGSSFDLKMLMCSATLIAPDVVMIAAHCIDFEYFEQMAGMQFEDVDLVFLERLTQPLRHAGPELAIGRGLAWDSATHLEWAMSGLQMGLAENDDIALLFLDEPIFDVEPAVLPTAEEADAIVEGAIVDIVGWGQQTSTRRHLPARLGSRSRDRARSPRSRPTSSRWSSKVMCASAMATPAGRPTSTSAAAMARDHRRHLSRLRHDRLSRDRRGGHPGRLYLDWIDAEMRSRCEDGTRSWCETDGIIPGFSRMRWPLTRTTTRSADAGTSAPPRSLGMVGVGLPRCRERR